MKDGGIQKIKNKWYMSNKQHTLDKYEWILKTQKHVLHCNYTNSKKDTICVLLFLFPAQRDNAIRVCFLEALNDETVWIDQSGVFTWGGCHCRGRYDNRRKKNQGLVSLHDSQ